MKILIGALVAVLAIFVIAQAIPTKDAGASHCTFSWTYGYICTTTPTPTPSPTPTPTPVSTSTYSEFEEEVFRLINVERNKADAVAYGGVTDRRDVVKDARLKQVADYRCEVVKTYFSHQDNPNTTEADGFISVMEKFGAVSSTSSRYYIAGEILARGYSTPLRVVTAWMGSSGHKAAILRSRFWYAGVAHCEIASGYDYWAVAFSGPPPTGFTAAN